MLKAGKEYIIYIFKQYRSAIIIIMVNIMGQVKDTANIILLLLYMRTHIII